MVEACRRAGISRTTFYEWRRRAQVDHIEGSGPQAARRAPVRAIAPELCDRIAALALAHPGWGCDRIAEALLANGSAPSAGTVQAILNDRRLGTRAARCTVLQRDPDGLLSPEQETAVSRHNPRWAHRHDRGHHPGARMVAGAGPLGRVHGIGRVLLVAAVDTCSGYAFARLAATAGPLGDPVSLLGEALPRFFAAIGVESATIALDPSAVLRFCPAGPATGDTAPAGAFDLGAEQDDRAVVNGWIEHLRQLVLVQVFRPATAAGHHPALSTLAGALERWLHAYNHDREQQGFPCYGGTPWSVIERWLARRRRARARLPLASVLACLAGAIPTDPPDPRAKVIDMPSPDGEAHVGWENHPDPYSPLRPELRCGILLGMS